MGIGGTPCPKPTSAKSRARANKKRAYTMEVNTARRQADAGMPAQRVVMSGALKGVGLDGDIEAEWYLGECKSYTPLEANGEKYIRFPVSWLDKVMEEGKLHGKPGLVVLQPKGAHSAFVVVDRDQFMALMGRAYKAIHGEDPQ